MFIYTRKDHLSGIQRYITCRIDGIDAGRFGIYAHGILDMSILIEDEFQGRGLGRGMIKAMLDHMRSEGAYNPSTFIYIDSDASAGFWNHIGMHANPNEDNITCPEYGYEKRITMEALGNF